MATKTFKIGLSNQDKQNMAQDVYERLLALTFPEYDTTAIYEVGDFVVYNDQLYKCIGATSGTWDATKWQLATLNDLLTDIESAVAFVNDKANVDGNYPTMTVGNADQLNSTVYVVDKVPYLYRTSGGDADIGNREYDKIIGGSIVVNQQFNYTTFATYTNNGITFTNNNDGSITLSGQASGGNAVAGYQTKTADNHKYLIKGCASGGSNSTYMIRVASTLGNDLGYDYGNGVIVNNTDGMSLFMRVVNGIDLSGGKTFVPNTFDLTQMLGSTIADYIYTLEQSNAGAGVAWFRNYFQELYYPYNAGAIKNVKLVSHDMVGFNQWDEEWELKAFDITTHTFVSGQRVCSKNPIKVLPNTTYYWKSSVTAYIVFYDANDNYLSYSDVVSNTTFTTPANASFIRFQAWGISTYNNDICINLSWSGWRNGQYESYQKNSYPLDTTIELRGIPKLDADNHLYFDGDEYSSDGKVVRKYGIVDLGTLDWVGFNLQDVGHETWRSQTSISGIKTPSSTTSKINLVCSMYDNSTVSEAYVHYSSKCISVVSNGRINIYDSSRVDYTDAEAFKSAMSRVYLVYELETTTEETADTYQEPQIVDDFGTEEYVVPTQDGWQVPVGHDTKYPANLRDKLQRLPDMPSVSQNVTETYVVNYNGTTKKCTFVAIDTWLGSNGYEKQEDVSSNLKVNENLTLDVLQKEVIKTGKIVNIQVRIKNNSENAIPAQTRLLKFDNDLYNPFMFLYFFGYISNIGQEIFTFQSGTNERDFVCTTQISAGASFWLIISYVARS